MGAGLLIEPVYNDSQQGGSLLAFIYKAWSERGGGFFSPLARGVVRRSS